MKMKRIFLVKFISIWKVGGDLHGETSVQEVW